MVYFGGLISLGWLRRVGVALGSNMRAWGMGLPVVMGSGIGGGGGSEQLKGADRMKQKGNENSLKQKIRIFSVCAPPPPLQYVMPPPPSSTLCPPPPVTEHVPLHSKSLGKKMARASGGANNAPTKLGGGGGGGTNGKDPKILKLILAYYSLFL